MKRLLFCLPLLLLAEAAVAGWDMLGRNEDLRLYVDSASIGRDGDVAALWQLIDYTSARWIDAGVVMSVRNLVEYDCAGRRARTVYTEAFSEQLGQGRQMFAERTPQAEWVAVPAASTGETLWRIACRVD